MFLTGLTNYYHSFKFNLRLLEILYINFTSGEINSGFP